MVVLEIGFVVPEEKVGSFSEMYAKTYEPALRKQEGYQGSRLLRAFDDEGMKAIGGKAPRHNVRLELWFDTEEQRQAWATSPEHGPAWEAATKLASEFEGGLYDTLS